MFVSFQEFYCVVHVSAEILYFQVSQKFPSGTSTKVEKKKSSILLSFSLLLSRIHVAFPGWRLR